MTEQQPSRYRCPTCLVAGCTERTNATVDFISDIRKQNIIEDFTMKRGCASHSDFQQPAPDKVGIHCPKCNWHQTVDKEMWEFQSHGGHGYTCGSGQCPPHTYMVRDKDEGHDTAIEQAARKDEREKVLKKLLKLIDDFDGLDDDALLQDMHLLAESLRQNKEEL